MPRLDRGIHAHACGHAPGVAMDPAVKPWGDRKSDRPNAGAKVGEAAPLYGLPLSFNMNPESAALLKVVA